MTSCLDCQTDLDHCHGTFVIHEDNTSTCSEAWCNSYLHQHQFVIQCSDFAGCSSCFEWEAEVTHAA